MASALKSAPPSAPDAELCRSLVRRVLASQAFARSERLSSFLACVAGLALEGRAGEINEQKIGEAVFGRPPGYDSMADGIVRTQASRLRQRLELYFSTEGANEPIRISIPKGGYVPVFEDRPFALPCPALVEQEPAQAATVEGPAPHRRWPRLLLPCLFGLALAAIACAVYLVRPTHADAVTADAFWSEIFPPRQTTLEVPGDSSLVIWEGLTNQNMDLADYLTGSYRTILPGSGPATDNPEAHLAVGRYTSIVDLEIAEALGGIARSHNGALQVRYARDVRPNDLKEGNAILAGDSEANPWVTLFEQNMNFVFSYDRGRRVNSVLNRHPQGNEAHQWDFAGSDKEHRVYAVVAFVSSLSGDGNVLILEGTSMAGTECAWDFVSDDSQLAAFLARIRHANHTIPHFEVVLESNNMSGSSTRASVLAWRIDR